jgi:N-formylmaleamate deformylase
MTTWRTATCETNGIITHYIRAGGAGHPLVLLHGLTANGACWTPVARVLETEFDLVMPDARGHGKSSAPPHGYRYDEHASDVAGLIDGLGLERPVLLGHSMGGMTAAVVATRAPRRIRCLVLVDPTFLSAERQREVHGSDVTDQHRQALAQKKSDLVARGRARHPHRSPELVELLAEARLQTHIQAFDVLTPPNPDYREVVKAIDVPILLVIGDRSPVVTPEMATELGRLNPGVQIEQVQNAGHGLPYEQPERLGEVVASFVRALNAGYS